MKTYFMEQLSVNIIIILSCRRTSCTRTHVHAAAAAAANSIVLCVYYTLHAASDADILALKQESRIIRYWWDLLSGVDL